MLMCNAAPDCSANSFVAWFIGTFVEAMIYIGSACLLYLCSSIQDKYPPSLEYELISKSPSTTNKLGSRFAQLICN